MIASRLQPGFSKNEEARLKPAEELKELTTQPPTEVGGNQDSCELMMTAQLRSWPTLRLQASRGQTSERVALAVCHCS